MISFGLNVQIYLIKISFGSFSNVNLNNHHHINHHHSIVSFLQSKLPIVLN